MVAPVTRPKVDIAAERLFGYNLKEALKNIDTLKQRLDAMDKRIDDLLKGSQKKLTAPSKDSK